MTTRPGSLRRRLRRAPDHTAGRSAAQRALAQIRLLAVALLVVGGAGYRPATGSVVPQDLGLPLAGTAAALLLLVSFLFTRSDVAGRRRSTLTIASTVLDAAVVLSVVWLAGLPPQSFALVLLLLPLLEAALWFGVSGLGLLWVASSVTLGALAVSFPAQVPGGALAVLVLAMPTLLLATIPVALLAEHLVAQVGHLAGARQVADDRARLLGDLSAVTAKIFPLDADTVLEQLVMGAVQLGAAGAVVTDPAGGRHARPVLATAGDAAALEATEPDAVADGAPRAVRLERELAVPGGTAYTFTAVVSGAGDELARHVEALDLLVAQARVALANAVLVHQLEGLKQTYQDQATRDQLTGLLNRRGLVSRAELLPGRLGVLFCDLDGFKGVNDTLGHAAGDELLVQVARRLEREVRSGTVLGRMGGDEFVLVVPAEAGDDLAALARRIEVDLGRPFLLEAGMARIGASVGVAHSGTAELDLETLLSQADHLMYEVKRLRKSDRASRTETVAVTA
jgi:diguanylate cyclase (GGDEF)-like protein